VKRSVSYWNFSYLLVVNYLEFNVQIFFPVLVYLRVIMVRLFSQCFELKK